MKRILISCASLGLLTSPVFAGFSATETTNHFAHRIYLQGGVGGMLPVVNKTHYVWSGPTTAPDMYISDKGMGDQGVVMLGVGNTWFTESNIMPSVSLGLRYTFTPTFDVKGYIDQFGPSASKNYFYKYSVWQQNIFVVTQANLTSWFEKINTFFLIGVGTSINYTSDYEEHARPGTTPRVSPSFGQDTSANFAYLLGVGLSYLYNKNITINGEYNYGMFGKISTGHGSNTSASGGRNYTSTALSNNLTGHILLLSMNYYF